LVKETLAHGSVVLLRFITYIGKYTKQDRFALKLRIKLFFSSFLGKSLMSKPHLLQKLAITGVAGAISAIALEITNSSAQAAVLNFNLSQSGWNGGGEVTAMFSGEDTNEDGFIDIADNEVFSYMMEFKGNTIIPDFTHNLNDLLFFRYTLGSSGFPPSFPLFSDNGSFFYDADDKVIGDSPPITGQSISTALAATVTVKIVPEPGNIFGLLAVGGLGLVIKREKQA
jgi:hypothetical protein